MNRAEAQERVGILTAREFEIFELLARGQTRVAIAEVLKISEATVSSHRRAIICKLGLNNPREASLAKITLLAVRAGILD